MVSAKFKLRVVSGTQSGREFVYDQHDTFLFGRMNDCHVCVPDDKLVSRHHFLLEVNPPYARLRDLGSLNGTHVNGQKVGGRQPHETPKQGALRRYAEVDLHDGDEIKVGDTVFRLSMETPLILPPLPIQCLKCRQDVSNEVGVAPHGDYLCEACRRQAHADPAALLMALLAQAIQPFGTDLKIPDYEIERKLGEGGMGVVYLARHKQTGHPVALKVMVSNVAVNESSRKQFVREVEITRTLRHRNIVGFLDFGSVGSAFYFLLEYCQGGSLADLLERHSSGLKLDKAGPIMLQALEGLAFAHSKNFVHRDLKPQNILLARQEGNMIAKVADMGLAKNFAKAGYSGMTATGNFGGSFPFMPREQVTDFKYMKPASDVWSIGASFYYLLTRHFPRDISRGQDPIDVILKNILVPIRKRDTTIPSRVAEVIDRSLSSDPKNRYANASEMRLELGKVL